MAETKNNAVFTSRNNMGILLGLILVLAMLFLPLPTFIIDMIVSFNIILSVITLLVTMYLQEPLQFSNFPVYLLIVTIFRLALGILLTRSILLETSAGNIVNSLGSIVIGGNYVVGVVIFLVLIIIQFTVVTSGSQRVAEVAARFTLDAMPGKQMAIDADLNAGFISEDQARSRRQAISAEADFYGAMDGAAKFVRGDAIASIIIIVVNILGGLIIGMVQKNFTFVQALQNYTLLTVGAGIVLQVPSLLISISTGVVVTRVASEENLGSKLGAQLFSAPEAIGLGALISILLGVVPGVPAIPFLILGAIAAFLAYTLQSLKKTEAIDLQKEEAQKKKAAETTSPAESIMPNLKYDAMRFEIGYGLIPLVDPKQGGDLLSGITSVRKQCALDLGIIVPPVRVRDNLNLKPNAYSIEIQGIEVARGELMVGRFLAITPQKLKGKIPGFETREPTFGLPAVWISPKDREAAINLGYTVVDTTAVVTTHLTEVIKSHAHELLGRQDIQLMLDQLKENYPAIVDEIVPNIMQIGEIQQVLKNLLYERIPICNLVTILETLGDKAKTTKDADQLTSFVRAALSKHISKIYQDKKGAIHCITINPKLEQKIVDSIEYTERGTFTNLPPNFIQKVIIGVSKEIQKLTSMGHSPIVVSSTSLRPHFKRIIDRSLPNLICLAYNEIDPKIEIQSLGMLDIADAN